RCQRMDPVDDRERSLLVRDGQVAAGETERWQRPQGGAQMFGLDGQRHVGACEAVLGKPIIVQFRRARMHHRIAHHAGEQEAIRMGHGSRRSVMREESDLCTYWTLGTSFLTVPIKAGGVW